MTVPRDPDLQGIFSPTFQPNDFIVTVDSAEGRAGGFYNTRLLPRSLRFRHRWRANHGSVKRRDAAIDLMDDLLLFEREFGGHR